MDLLVIAPVMFECLLICSSYNFGVVNSFCVVRYVVYSPLPAIQEESLQQELKRIRELSEKLARDIVEVGKEIADVAERTRKTEYKRRQGMPSDDIAVQLSALLELSRVEHAAEQ